MRINEAVHETADAFDPQLPMGGPPFGGADIPAGIEYTAGDKAVLRYYAPSAAAVSVRIGHLSGRKLDLSKREGGVWELAITQKDLERETDRYAAIFFEIDGVYALNPMAPIAFCHSHPINFIDFPCGEGYYDIKDVPHGTVARDYYYSRTCGCFKSCLVYTPPGYNGGDGADLPVLYLQHGYGENETSWVHLGKVNFIMDNLIAEGKAEPCVIVMNNGMTQTAKPDGSRKWDALTIEPLLLNDCIPHIESCYRVSRDKWRRGMAGLSMGSMQTSVTTLKNPGMFGYVGIFSGFLGALGGLGGDDAHFAALDDKESLYAAYKLFFRCIGGNDTFMDTYADESGMLAGKGLTGGGWAAYKETIYEGGHDWNVWRQSIRDFLALAFK